jgi:hypothetical protein
VGAQKRAWMAVRLTVREMGNGVQRVEAHEIVSPDGACSYWGAPGAVLVPSPMPTPLLLCIEDAMMSIGEAPPADTEMQACVRYVSDDTIEAVALWTSRRSSGSPACA